MYPIGYEADIPTEGRKRLTVFFRYFTAIPIQIVAALFAIGGMFAAIVAWFAIVFTGRYPDGIYNFNSKVLRITARANAYYYLAVDDYPPFNGEEAPEYAVRIRMPEPLESYSRLKTLFRLIIGIPVMVLAYLQNLIASVLALVGWFAIVFTGRLPEGFVKPLRDALAYQARATGYLFTLQTEGWPPFSDDGK